MFNSNTTTSNYGQSGSSEAKKTIQGKTSAIQQFYKMLYYEASEKVTEQEQLSIIQSSILSFDKMTEISLCDINLYSRFAYYLVHHAVSRADKQQLARDTALQYFRGFKEAVKERFPQNSIWKNHDKEENNKSKFGWYSKIQRKISDDFNKRSVNNGEHGVRRTEH